MPSRPQVHRPHSATSTTTTTTTSKTSSHTLNEAVTVLQRKLTANHLDQFPSAHPTSPPTHPHSSFMDSILHHKSAAKKHDEAKDREARNQKRLSLSMRGSSKSKDRVATSSPRLGPAAPGKFQLIIESPPLIFYGNISNSTGALLSGRLKLLVEDPAGEVTFTKFTMACKAVTTTKRPVTKECRDCTDKVDELKRWNFLSEPVTYRQNQDTQFPFSFLLPGHLPATTHAQLGSVDYSLVATATTAHGEKIEYIHPLLIQRAFPPGPDKSSIRIFPPTNLTCRVNLPPVVHPIGTFPVSMSLSGIVEKKSESTTRWRLRKLMWRIEEHSKIISVPCNKHTGKLSEGKAVQHQETKVLGNDETKSGWKTDFDTIGGEIMLEFDASMATKSSHKATCDVESNSGLEVRHNLVLELIVAEEFCPNRNPTMITPTGAARVLRMQFALIVTERAGMGISWDEEMPPMYEDVPDSPPGYGSADKNDGAWGGAIMEDYNGPELEYEELERMHSENPHDPPRYRERDMPSLDLNEGLPMRSQSARRSSLEQGPSGVAQPARRTVGRWTEDELGAEPPQYALRARQAAADSQTQPVEDYGEGMTGNTAV